MRRGADTPGMFAARQRPLLVLEDRLLALRLSLNTPVLATEELPSGPARALICAWAEGNVRRFAVAVRALNGGNAVVYELELEVPADADGWSVALDASLSFGESMGFVFDDEVITDRRPDTLRRAIGLLRALLAPGDLELEDDPAVARDARIGSADDLSEILLEDELDGLASDGGGPESGATGPLVPEELAAPAAFAADVALSKFRSPAASPATRQPAPMSSGVAAARPSAPEPPPLPAREQRGGATLGRVRPVRVRVDADSGEQADPLVRLLADF